MTHQVTMVDPPPPHKSKFLHPPLPIHSFPRNKENYEVHLIDSSIGLHGKLLICCIYAILEFARHAGLGF